jgi:DNA primase
VLDRWHAALSKHYNRRVLIPIYDLDGKLVSFQGRDITGTAEKKYLFPPGYARATGEHLYNGHNVIGRPSDVVVGEGAFDVIAIKVAFDADPTLRDVVPVGTFGKHLSHGAPQTPSWRSFAG